MVFHRRNASVFCVFVALGANRNDCNASGPTTCTDCDVSFATSCTDIISAYVRDMHVLSSSQMNATLVALQHAVHAMDVADAINCSVMAADLGISHAVGLAHLAEQVALHPDCFSELETKSFAQTRCSQKYYKIAIHFLSVANLTELANHMWTRATSLRLPRTSERPIGWRTTWETPTVWIDALSSRPTWDCSLWPFVGRLESASPQILREVRAASANFASAYPYLTRGGTWQNMFIFRGHDWNHELCAFMPFTCRLLLPELPTKPDVPYTTAFNEEVVIFRSEPGAAVGAHCGSSNNVVNLHLTLTGGHGARLRVGKEQISLQDGRAVCFQDSFFHALDHKGGGDADRISLVVRVMHPEMSMASYGNALRTDVSDLSTWSVTDVLSSEVDRLRNEHRKLNLAPHS